MRSKTTAILAIALAVVFGLAAAGCGGSSKSSSPATTEAATTAPATTAEAPPTTDAATTAPATTAAPPTTAPATTASTPPVTPISASDCQDLQNIGQTIATAMSGSGGADIEKVATALQQVADKAPADIRPDFQVLADAIKKIADALKGYNPSSGQPPTADQLQKLQSLATAIDQKKLAAAEQHISAWLQAHCKA